MRILVTWASGRVGRHVVRQLAQQHALTATGRSAQPTPSAGICRSVAWHQADLTDPEPWPALLDGIEAALLFPAFGHTQHFIAAAIAAGLPKLVLLSSGAVGDTEGSVIKTIHAEIEAQAATSGIPTVRVRPTVFMANDLCWLPIIRSGDPVPLAHPNAAMPVVAEQDVAAVIAACLAQHADQDTYEVAGPNSLTQIERLEVFSQHATGDRARWTDITEVAVRNGTPDNADTPEEYLLRSLARAARGLDRSIPDLSQTVGRPATDYTSWVRQELA